MRLSVFMMGLCLFSSSLIAKEAIKLDLSKAAFAEQQAKLVKTLSEDTNYSEMSQTDRAEVVSALERISEKLPSGATITSLAAEEKHAVELDQTAINELVAKAYRDSRLVCTKEPTLGSNMIRRVCKTAAARNRDNQKTRDNGIKVSQ
jgi:hypothetical protein